MAQATNETSINDLKNDLKIITPNTSRIYSEVKHTSSFLKEYGELQTAMSKAEKAIKSNTKTGLSDLKKSLDKEFLDVKKFDKNSKNIDKERQDIIKISNKANEVYKNLKNNYSGNNEVLQLVQNTKNDFDKNFRDLNGNTIKSLAIKEKILTEKLANLSNFKKNYELKKEKEEKNINKVIKNIDVIVKECNSIYSQIDKKYGKSEVYMKEAIALKYKFTSSLDKYDTSTLSRAKDKYEIMSKYLSDFKQVKSTIESRASVENSTIDQFREFILTGEKNFKSNYLELKSKNPDNNENAIELNQIYLKYYNIFEGKKVYDLKGMKEKHYLLGRCEAELNSFKKEMNNEKNQIDLYRKEIMMKNDVVRKLYIQNIDNFGPNESSIKNNFISLKLDFDRVFTYLKIENLSDAKGKLNKLSQIENELESCIPKLNNKENKSLASVLLEKKENKASENEIKETYGEKILTEGFAYKDGICFILNYNSVKGNFVVPLLDFEKDIRLRDISNINGKGLVGYFNYCRLKNNDENIFSKFRGSFKNIKNVAELLKNKVNSEVNDNSELLINFIDKQSNKFIDIKKKYFNENNTLKITLNEENIKNNINGDYSTFFKVGDISSLNHSEFTDVAATASLEGYKIFEGLDKKLVLALGKKYEAKINIFCNKLNECSERKESISKLLSGFILEIGFDKKDIVAGEMIASIKTGEQNISSNNKKIKNNLTVLEKKKKELEKKYNLEKDLGKKEKLVKELYSLNSQITYYEKQLNINTDNNKIFGKYLVDAKITECITKKEDMVVLSKGSEKEINKIKAKIALENKDNFSAKEIKIVYSEASPYLTTEQKNDFQTIYSQKAKQEKLNEILIDNKLGDLENRVFNSISNYSPTIKTVPLDGKTYEVKLNGKVVVGGKEIQGLVMNKQEMGLVNSSPETLKNIVDFKEKCNKLNMNLIYQYRENIFNVLSGVSGLNFDQYNGYLSETEVNKLFILTLNAIGIKVNKNTNTKNLENEISKTNLQDKVFKTNEVNNYGDSKIDSIFREKLLDKNNGFRFKNEDLRNNLIVI